MPLETLIILPVTIVSFVALLTIIVFIHEYGHFSVARLLGVRVEVFSIGFGKPLLRWTDRKGTEWRVARWPLGGYVKFFGDLNPASQAAPQAQRGPATTQFPSPGHEEEVAEGMTAEERKVCFHFKPVWARALIVAAGPFANFALAVAIFTVMFATLGRVDVAPAVGSVFEDSAAEEAGLMVGDRIISMNGQPVQQFRQLQDQVLSSGGAPLRLVVERGGEEVPVELTPRRTEREDRYGNMVESWMLGIAAAPDNYNFRKYNLIEAFAEGVGELGRILRLTVQIIGRIILGQENADQLGGPVKMAQYAGQSVMSGFDATGADDAPGLWTMLRVSLVDFISLAALVSVSIGFLNLLPVPVLDGGHLMYYAYEAIAGKPLGERAQAIGFRVGIVLLASLMIFVTWNDISNLLTSIS